METKRQDITRTEIVKIITAIKMQCQDALPYRNESEFDILVDMWFEILKEYQKDIVWLAVKNALKNTVYQRQNWIGAICQEIEKMRDACAKSDTDLWADIVAVLPVVENSSYKFNYTAIEENGKEQGENEKERVREIYNNLPVEIKSYLGSVSRLVEISRLDSERINIEKGRFLKVMPQIKETMKTRAQIESVAGLLPSVRVLLIDK